jgi:NADH-quinone oxidoreductase subunit E
MNAKRKDDLGQGATPQDAVQGLVRATADAMETFMTAKLSTDGDKTGAPFNPLLSNPATMMAAATAIGLTMTGYWASAFLRAFEASDVGDDAEATVTPSQRAQEPEAAREPKAAEELEAALPLEAAALVEDAVKVSAEVVSVDDTAEDDLKRISGIGPKLAKVLMARGFTQFAHIAELDETAAKALDEELGLYGRILRDDWIGQAKAILAEKM